MSKLWEKNVTLIKQKVEEKVGTLKPPLNSLFLQLQKGWKNSLIEASWTMDKEHKRVFTH